MVVVCSCRDASLCNVSPCSCAFARGPVIFVSLLWTILWQALRAPHMTMLVNVLQGLLLLPGGAACVAAVAFTLATLAAALRAHSIQRRMTDLHGIYAAMSSGSNAYALTMDVHTGRLGVARKQRDLSALLAACTGSLGAIFVAIGMHLSSTISAALTGGRLEIRDAYRLAGALASSSSQWAPVVGLWVAVKLLGLMALVCLSRALQNLWDAEDDFTAAFPLQPLEDADEGASSRQMLAACQAHVLKHEAVPSTLEKVADGRYARTADDAEARSEGIQLSTNPLHELRAVQGALQRRARRSFRQQHGHKPLASVCTDCHRAVSAVSSDSSAAATAMATLPTLHALPVKDATAAATGSSTSLQPASPLPAYMRSRCTACRTNLEAVRRSVLVARSLQHSLQHGLHVVASVTSVAHHSGNGTPKAAGGCGGRDAGVCAGPPNRVCLTSVTPSVISSPTGGEPSHTSITNPMYQASSAVAAVQQKPPAALVPGLRLPLPAMPVAPLASPLVQSARGGRALALGSPRAFVAAASEVVAAGLVLTSPRGGSGPAHDRAHDRAQRPQAPAPLAAAASNGPAPSCVITDACHRSDVAIHAAGAGASVQSPTAASMAALVRFAVSPSGCMPASLSDVTPRMADAREPCFICFECEGDAVFMECGHGGVCARCARTILCGVTGIDGVEEGHKEPRCPMVSVDVAMHLLHALRRCLYRRHLHVLLHCRWCSAAPRWPKCCVSAPTCTRWMGGSSRRCCPRSTGQTANHCRRCGLMLSCPLSAAWVTLKLLAWRWTMCERVRGSGDTLGEGVKSSACHPHLSFHLA